MAPATKRKIEEEAIAETKRNTKVLHKPTIISSVQFDRSFKLLEKTSKEKDTKQIAPRLDAPRRFKSEKSASSNTDAAACTSNIIDKTHISEDDMEGDWEQPRKTQKLTQMNNHNKTLELTNKYQTLNTQNQTEADEHTINSHDKNRKAAQKPPPITVQNSTIKSMINLITAYNINKESVRLRQIYGLDNTINIQTDNITNYNEVIKALKENQAEFYTYTPKSEKIKSIVLKGVKGDFTEENILEELNSLKFANVKIIKISKIRFNRENSSNHHFLVQISNDSHLSELMKTKHILYQSVKWEHLKKKKIFQCKNCQRLGHASSNCHLKYRCVKCSLSHNPGECSITEKTDAKQLKCANCGDEGHPASYRGCPYIKNATKLVNNVKRANKTSISNKITDIQRKVSPGISYAAIASGPLINTQTSNTQHTNAYQYDPKRPENSETNHKTSDRQNNSNDLPPWVNMLKQEMLNIVNRLASIEKQLSNDNHRINSIFEILQCQIEAA